MNLEQTIVALGSGIAPGNRAVVRLSGTETRPILEQVVETPVPLGTAAIAFSSAVQIQLRPETAQKIDVLCYWWPSSRSFTGEPCAELHFIGSMPIAESMIDALVRAGAQPARRGDFTLRSFLAGKLDLTQAEAVLAVISAETDAELQAALGQLAGNLSEPIRELRDQLLALCAHLEAGLDFVEEDIEFIQTQELLTDLSRIMNTLRQIQESLRSRGGRSRLPTVVLVGLPNAGKSSLLNVLTEQDRAIISPQAGTTRDAIECSVKFSGQQLRLVDTAGIEELTESSPRKLAQSVLEARISEADLTLLCYDLSQPPSEEWLAEQTARLEVFSACILVGTKSDMQSGAAGRLAEKSARHVSALKQVGIAELRSDVLDRLSELKDSRKSDALHHTMIRCCDAIARAMNGIRSAMHNAENEIGEEIVAADLRIAIDELSFVIGEVHTEDILGEIFSRFCIGK